jgi:phage-related tail fiber protein
MIQHVISDPKYLLVILSCHVGPALNLLALEPRNNSMGRGDGGVINMTDSLLRMYGVWAADEGTLPCARTSLTVTAELGVHVALVAARADDPTLKFTRIFIYYYPSITLSLPPSRTCRNLSRQG